MCQAIPSRVRRVEDGRAEVLLEGRPAWVSTLAVPDTAPGDYLIVYAGHALERLLEHDALALLAALAELDDGHGVAGAGAGRAGTEGDRW